jgi:hypothetical protein
VEATKEKQGRLVYIGLLDDTTKGVIVAYYASREVVCQQYYEDCPSPDHHQPSTSTLVGYLYSFVLETLLICLVDVFVTPYYR